MAKHSKETSLDASTRVSSNTKKTRPLPDDFPVWAPSEPEPQSVTVFQPHKVSKIDTQELSQSSESEQDIFFKAINYLDILQHSKGLAKEYEQSKKIKLDPLLLDNLSKLIALELYSYAIDVYSYLIRKQVENKQSVSNKKWIRINQLTETDVTVDIEIIPKAFVGEEEQKEWMEKHLEVCTEITNKYLKTHEDSLLASIWQHHVFWILFKLEKEFGKDVYASMSEDELVNKFKEYVAESPQKPEDEALMLRYFRGSFIKDLAQVIPDLTIEQLEVMLGLIKTNAGTITAVVSETTAKAPPPSTPDVFSNPLLTIPSQFPVQALLRAIQDAAEGAKGWCEKEGVPTYLAKSDDASIYITLQDPPADPASLWEYVRSLDDLAGDVFTAALSQWLFEVKHPDQPVWISIDKILDARGLKRKHKDGYSAGHRSDDRRKVADCFELMDKVYQEVFNLKVHQSSKSKAKRISIESKAMAITDRAVEKTLFDGEVGTPIAFRVSFGEFGKLLVGELGRQTALLFRQALEYDPYREDWEKRLARYLAFQWAIRKAHGNLDQPFRISTLLENVQKEPNKRFPDRTKSRLEKALDKLHEDKIIAGWEYRSRDEFGSGDEDGLPSRNWLPKWLEWRVLIVPPDVIRERYQAVAENYKKHTSQGALKSRTPSLS